MSTRPLAPLLFALPLLALLAPAARADVTFGGSRAAGMGGAGLALPVDVFQNTRLNPALHAFGPKGLRLQYPQFGYRTQGLSLGEASDLVKDLTRGGSANTDLALRLARRFGGDRREFGAEAGLAVFGGGFVLSGFGEVEGTSIPNAALRTFIRNGGDPNNAPLDAQLDAYAFGYTSVGLGYANAVQLPRARLALGGRLKSVRGYYAHKKAQGPSISSNTTGGVVNGSNIPAGDDYLNEGSVGLDLGAIYSLDRVRGLTLGAVVENAIAPKVRFDSERPDNGGLRPDYVDPFRTALNLGAGYAYRRNLLFAADAIDVGNRAGRAEFRTGVEIGLARAFAGRAGYNSRTGFTYGLAVGGFNIGLGGRSPVTIATSVRF